MSLDMAVNEITRMRFRNLLLRELLQWARGMQHTNRTVVELMSCQHAIPPHTNPPGFGFIMVLACVSRHWRFSPNLCWLWGEGACGFLPKAVAAGFVCIFADSRPSKDVNPCGWILVDGCPSGPEGRRQDATDDGFLCASELKLVS